MTLGLHCQLRLHNKEQHITTALGAQYSTNTAFASEVSIAAQSRHDVTSIAGRFGDVMRMTVKYLRHGQRTRTQLPEEIQVDRGPIEVKRTPNQLSNTTLRLDVGSTASLSLWKLDLGSTPSEG